MWPNARVSVRGGEQAANVLAMVRSESMARRGTKWTSEQEEAFKEPILRQYERQGSPYYSTARIWDDGIIDPLETRKVLALGISAARNRFTLRNDFISNTNNLLLSNMQYLYRKFHFSETHYLKNSAP